MGYKARQNHTTENESPRKTPFLILGPMFSEHFSHTPHLLPTRTKNPNILTYLTTVCPHDKYQN